MKSLLAKAITYDFPETLPISVGMLPAAWIKYGAELQRVVSEYPQFFGETKTDLNKIGMSPSYRSGSFTDEWGCVWENIHEGMESIVKGHPIKSEQDVFDLAIPPDQDGHLPLYGARRSGLARCRRSYRKVD